LSKGKKPLIVTLGYRIFEKSVKYLCRGLHTTFGGVGKSALYRGVERGGARFALLEEPQRFAQDLLRRSIAARGDEAANEALKRRPQIGVIDLSYPRPEAPRGIRVL
jgi:hypothetical protein